MTHVIYVIDLDGTLYDNSHRAHLVPQNRNDTAAWAAFNGACEGDTPRPAVRDMVSCLLESGKRVVFLTGRGDSAKDATTRRLVKDFGALVEWDLIMRSMVDFRPSPKYKRWVMKCLQLQHDSVHFLMLEDDPDIVNEIYGMDRVTVLQIDSLCADVRSR